MRIVFLGTPEFAVASLKALLATNHQIVGVVTAPDRPAGRGRLLKKSAVKEFAEKNHLPILQPENLKNVDFLEELKNLKADIQIVVAFRMLPEVVWNMPELGTYNLHGSLLPRYRGAAPINRAIINGEKTTGVTTFKLQQQIDSGNILFQSAVEIGQETTAGELHDLLMVKGADLLVKTVEHIGRLHLEGKQPEFIKQREDQVTHAPKIFRDDCEIDWNLSAEKIHNLIRGLSPSPGAFTTLQLNNGKRIQVKIFKAKIDVDRRAGGNVGDVDSDGLFFVRVRCSGGWLELQELQLEGKKRMGVSELLRGFVFESNCRMKNKGE